MSPPSCCFWPARASSWAKRSLAGHFVVLGVALLTAAQVGRSSRKPGYPRATHPYCRRACIDSGHALGLSKSIALRRAAARRSVRGAYGQFGNVTERVTRSDGEIKLEDGGSIRTSGSLRLPHQTDWRSSSSTGGGNDGTKRMQSGADEIDRASRGDRPGAMRTRRESRVLAT